MVAQIDTQFIKTRPGKVWPRLLAYTMFEGRPLTTRGRWINPLVFGGYRLWSALPIRKPVDRPVFILGVGRSGTTILGTILALHRDVGYLNEPKALWQAALGDDDLIGSYSRRAGRFRMTAADATPGVKRRLHRYYRTFLRLSGNRRVVDKYPELVFRNGLLNAVFPDARKIMLIRNGADTCQSIANWSLKHGQQADDWWGRNRQKWHLLVDQLIAPDPYFAPVLADIRGLSRHMDMAAVEWIVTMREALQLQVQNPGSLHFVRYEDLTADPAATIPEILQFCGLQPDVAVTRYAKQTLKPRAPYPPPDLHPAIQGMFEDTMKSLGYETPAPQ